MQPLEYHADRQGTFLSTILAIRVWIAQLDSIVVHCHDGKGGRGCIFHQVLVVTAAFGFCKKNIVLQSFSWFNTRIFCLVSFNSIKSLLFCFNEIYTVIIRVH